MSGTLVQIALDGQAVNRDDFNTVASQAATAGDVAFSQVSQPPPYTGTVSRGVVSPIPNLLLVGVNGLTGVQVLAHTAFVGPLNGATDNVITMNVSAGTLVLPSGSGNSAHARYDLIYESITINAPLSPVTRKRKDPTSKAVSAVSVSTEQINISTLQFVSGSEFNI